MIMGLGRLCCTWTGTEWRDWQRRHVDFVLFFFSFLHSDVRVVHINGHVHIERYWLVMFMTPLEQVLWCAATDKWHLMHFCASFIVVCIQSNYFKVFESWIASIGIKIRDCVKMGIRKLSANFQGEYAYGCLFLHNSDGGVKESKSLANQRT